MSQSLSLRELVLTAQAGVQYWTDRDRSIGRGGGAWIRGDSWLVNRCPAVRVTEFILGALVAVDRRRGKRGRASPSPQPPLSQSRSTSPTGPHRAADRSLVWCGQVSYCFYLVHGLVLLVLVSEFGWGFLPSLLVGLPAAVGAAAALHYVVERPCEAWIRGGRNSVVVAPR